MLTNCKAAKSFSTKLEYWKQLEPIVILLREGKLETENDPPELNESSPMDRTCR